MKPTQSVNQTHYTPGPWKTTRRTFNYGCYGHEISTTEDSQRVLVTPRRAAIATINSDDDEDRANARLIAASPELLSALEGLLSNWDAMRERFGDKWPIDLSPVNYEKLARAAIQRAKGGK